MRKLSIVLITIGLLFSCEEKQSNKENINYLKNLKKYIGIQFPNMKTTDYTQFVVIPNRGCIFCLNKASELYSTQDWEKTLFISNRDSSYFLNSRSYRNVLLDIDQDFLGEINLNLQMQPTVYQVGNGVEMLHLTSRNWKEVYSKVSVFDNPEK